MSNYKLAFLLSTPGILLWSAIITACASRQPSSTKQHDYNASIDMSIAKCIYNHVEINDERQLQKTCMWSEDDSPRIKELLISRNQGLVKARDMALFGLNCKPMVYAEPDRVP